MHFNKTTEYAIRVMVYLARFKGQRFSANRLNKELHIPYKYLSHLMSRLSSAGLVDVTAGKYGGYAITRALNTIYLYQIAGLVEGLDDYERCVLGFAECSDENPCTLHKIWLAHREGMKETMFNTSLADLDYTALQKY